MYKVGFIRKIDVRNFVTYDYVQMFPGSNLNMIVGPNGTGKSTIVAAIILGLGGNAKTVGRGTKVSEYVKRDCEKATINIYLQGHEENEFLQITREFDKYDKSTWKINGQMSTMSDVIQCTKQFNIQVDNLCQFLPQDRVADFAKLNKKELLKQTQIALCKEDLIEKQVELISTRQHHKGKLENIKKLAEKLQETKDANSRLEGKVTNFNKMLEYKEKIVHMERKIEWTIFDEKRAQIEEIKKDKSEAQKVLEMYRNELIPIETLISHYKEKQNKKQRNDIIITQKIRDLERDIDQTCENIDTVNSKIGEIEDEINMGLSEINNRNQQIQETLLKLEDKKKLHTTAINKVAQNQQDKLTATNEISKCSNVLNQLRTNRMQLEQALIEENSKLKVLQNEISRIENIKQGRLEQLKRLSEDAYTAVMWLRNNKHQFKGDVFEPIMLELNVLERNKVKYIESIIPFRDRMAFTCTDKRDMNMVIHCLREEQRLSINVLHSDYSSTNRHQSEIPLELLRKYGFYTYVNMLFSAPDPIMNYLCQTYKLHNIPIGDASTNSCYEQVPRNLVIFFSDVFRFTINYSKYTGEKSTTQNEVKGDGGFSFVLDSVLLENLRGRFKENENRIKELQGKIQDVDAQITKVQEKTHVFREKINEIQRYKREAESIENSIAMVQQNLRMMRNSIKNPEKVREEGKEKLKCLVEGVSLLQETLLKQMQQLKDSIKENNLNFLKVIWIREKTDQLENSSSDTKRKLKEAENTFNAILDKYKNLMQDGKTQLQKAKSISNGFTPSDDGFDEFREIFDQLPCDLEDLNMQKENIITKISCLNTADGGELEKYQNGQKLIENLIKELELSNKEVYQIEKKMERLQKEWLEPLNELIFAINTRFSTAFERMGCAGEVTIYKGDDDQNFADYGISIKVSYRSGEPLQELTATVQSGGERAVATAAFVLSLQELTPVPFRCVDEINQGMDSNNERRIFELIVQTTCQADTSQYFIITPKLVPNLSYPRQMLVHFVHNGPFINSDRKWAFSKLCNPQKIK